MNYDIGFIGFINAGGSLPLGLQCRGGSDVPTAPDAAPSYAVYSPSFGAALTTGSLGAADTDTKAGFRTGTLTIDGSFVAGTLYTIRFAWAISAVAKSAIGTFMVT